MAYGGKCDVTKSVVFYVKNHPYLSNAELDRDIRAKFGCTYADSTYERIRNGAYDAKFNLTNYSSGYEDDAIYGKNQRNTSRSAQYQSNTSCGNQYNSRCDNRYKDTMYDKKVNTNVFDNRGNKPQSRKSSGNSKEISGTNYLIAFCTGGLGIYGLFHGATPFHNFGAFVIALILIIIAIGSLSGE